MTSNDRVFDPREYRFPEYDDMTALNALHIKDSFQKGQEGLEEDQDRLEFWLPWQVGYRGDCETKEDVETLLELTEKHKLLVDGIDGHFRGSPHTEYYEPDENNPSENPVLVEETRCIPSLSFFVLKDSTASSWMKILIKESRLNACIWEGRSGKPYKDPGYRYKRFSSWKNKKKGRSWKSQAGPPACNRVSIEDYNLEHAELFKHGSTDVYICMVAMEITDELYDTEKTEDFNNAIEEFNLIEILLSLKKIAESGNDEGDSEEWSADHGTSEARDQSSDSEDEGP